MRHLLHLALLGAALPAGAQVAIYGEFSAANFNVPNVGYQYGSTFGLYYDKYKIPFFKLGLDGRGTVVGGGSDGASVRSGLGGPRVSFKLPVIPFRPYVEGLVGAASAHAGAPGSAAYYSATKFEYNGVAGLDYTVLPFIDWRVFEFSYGGLSSFNGSFNPRVLSTGIVFRLP